MTDWLAGSFYVDMTRKQNIAFFLFFPLLLLLDPAVIKTLCVPAILYHVERDVYILFRSSP